MQEITTMYGLRDTETGALNPVNTDSESPWLVMNREDAVATLESIVDMFPQTTLEVVTVNLFIEEE